MLLTSITQKPVVVSGNLRGVCLGVGVSLKTRAVKYLLCASSPQGNKVDFCVNYSAVDKIDEAVFLQRLRPVFPKNCAQITLSLPVFSADGGFLGKIVDLDIQNQTVIRLFTEKKSFAFTTVQACTDAVILRKEQPFPLGQRVPAPAIFQFSDKSEPIVTKRLLRQAIEKKSLVKLTLSLSPFNLNFLPLDKKFKD